MATVPVLRRKLIWIPLTVLCVLGVAGFVTNYLLMRSEKIVWEVGEGIRSRLDDLGADFSKGDRELIASYYGEQFTGSQLGFAGRQRASDEGGILLEDWRAPAEVTTRRAQFVDELLAYRAQLGKPEASKFKMVFLNEYTANSASILMRFQVYAHDPQGHPIEDRGKFNVELVRQDGEWRFVRQQLVDATRVTGIDSQYFTNVTQQSGIDFNTGVNELFKKQHYVFAIADRQSGGAASGDYDNDGLPDLLLAGSGGSKLYRNTGHGGFEDVTAKAGLATEATRYAQGAVFADYNNDGCLDLFLTRTPKVTNKLFRNNCNGTFTDVTKEAGVEFASYSTSAAFADVNNDGFLDLYVGVYGKVVDSSPDPQYRDRHGVPNKLYRNNGNGTFTDISHEAGVDDPGWTLAVTFFDYDNDGNQDLYVANDFGPSSLYHNDGTGHFTMVGREAGALNYGFGMSASPGDYNNDGNLDLYVSHVNSGTTWYLDHSVYQLSWVRFIDPRHTLDALAAGIAVYRDLGLTGA
ncbi:MAG TPA: VCBS repeat-containing protein, partial [Candidatus Acidoferrum sp.]|nr:VCBS repeat-containing protein [Candidatus Acidoferrum sp.]